MLDRMGGPYPTEGRLLVSIGLKYNKLMAETSIIGKLMAETSMKNTIPHFVPQMAE